MSWTDEVDDLTALMMYHHPFRGRAHDRVWVNRIKTGDNNAKVVEQFATQVGWSLTVG